MGGWVFFWGGERRGGGVGRLIEGGGVGRPDGKNLQILDLHRLAPLRMILTNKYLGARHGKCSLM